MANEGSSAGQNDSDTSGSESDWEEVVDDEYHHIMARLENPSSPSGNTASEAQNEEERQKQHLASIPENGLKIIIPGTLGRRGKKKADIVANYLIREINKSKKEVQLDLHRVSLLCLLSRGLQYNTVLSSEVVLGVSLSTLPSERSYPPKNVDLNYFEKFLKWFRSNFKVLSKDSQEDPAPVNVEELLTAQLSDRKVSSHQILVFMFVTILRALGVQVRLVWNLVPLPLKPDTADLMKLLKDESDKPAKPESSTKKGAGAKDSPSSKASSSGSAASKRTKAERSRQSSSSSDNSSDDSESEEQSKTSARRALRERAPVKKESAKPVTAKKADKSKSKGKNGNKSDQDFEDPEFLPVKRGTRSAAKKETPLGKKPTANVPKADSKTAPVVKQNRAKKENPNDKPSTSNAAKKQMLNYKPSASNAAKKETLTNKPSTSTGPKNTGRKLISSSEEDTSTVSVTSKAKPKYDFWAEVYLEEEERWVSVDLVDGKILCDSTLEAKATHPCCYVISYGNTGNVKDVTNRYASQWLTNTQRGRDHEWWMKSIRPFRGRRTERDRAEDEYIDQHLRSLPLPKSIQEFKSHPMFALRRHLLKFEAIYPPDCNPCGFIKDEAVYPRSSVHTLYSRETWVKKAKVVRVNEKPYKVVKARPKYDRFTGNTMGDRPLDLFGEWQVEDYQCPIAQDGKVPRNEYGNVELYKETMLPIGTVHLRAPGLNRIARKLDIDCANAMVGFDYHAGGSHPMFDGFVVCEEFKDILLDAWNQEQDEQKKKDEAKRLLKIYKNWERLCRGLLIRHRLETQYSYNLSGKRQSVADDVPAKKRKK